MAFQFTPIGTVHSCFKEKFGIPRQGALIPESKATIKILPPFNDPNTMRGIESYSHLWILFIFHANPTKRFKPTVRPPRLGGNQRIGVFASRSGFRPNPIGLSLVTLERFHQSNHDLFLDIRGADLMEGTPILDIKPYLPWADRPNQSSAGIADTPPSITKEVRFSAEAEYFFTTLPAAEGNHLRNLIRQMLQNDPRPAIDHHRSPQKIYGACLYDWNIRWKVSEGLMQVVEILPTHAQK